MGTLSEDLTAIKNVEDTLIANKVARFSYTDTAYANDDANGVDSYNFNNEQNIPNPTTTVLKVNSTVLDKGYRAQASSITRMLINHFFGRVSYNLNKINDNMSALIATLRSHTGTANGIATLDSNSLVPYTQLPVLAKSVCEIVADSNREVDLTQQTDLTKILNKNLINQIFGTRLGRVWANGTGFPNNVGIQSIYYANGIWVGASGDARKGLWWSEDGKTWYQGTSDNQYMTSCGFTSVYYANGLWCACGTYPPFGSSGGVGMFWSVDGKTWTLATSGQGVSFRKVLYANGLWVAVSGTISEQGIWWSEDGDTWTQCTDGSTFGFWDIYYANGLWVAGSNQGGTFISTDGKNWERYSSITTCYSIWYSNGMWIAGTSNGLAYSEDLENDGWSRTDITSGNFWSVRYANGMWVATSYTYIFWSIDGIHWTQGNVDSGHWECVYFANGMWIATDSSTNSNSLGVVYSIDGKNWTQVTGKDLMFYRCYSPYFANGIWVFGSYFGIAYSDYALLLENGDLS